MSLQEYRIHLINNQVIHAAEELFIPEDAGFPNGLGTTVEEVIAGLGNGRLVLEEGERLIGEACYRKVGEAIVEIGIKICETDCQNRGLGRIILSMLISWLFEQGFEKIVLDTNLTNKRAQHVYESLGFQKMRVNLRAKSESVELAKDIRIFGLQNWLNELLDQIHNLYLDFTLRCERVEVIADITEAVLTMARNGIAYVYLINMALNEGLSVSEFLLYFTAVTTFTTWVMGILQEMSALHKESLDISRLREFLEYPEPFKFEEGEIIPDADTYKLKLENVSFRYPGTEKDIIHDLNLTVHPGEKLAIVGLNGAGKTTLVKLLCGLLDPTEGKVLLNGKDIREFNRRNYYDLFSAVFQEFSVLDVTVAEEIAQTTVGIDYDRIADCIEKAGLTAMIEKLPKGLQTHVGREVHLDGVLFSGGQTQRLMLARALYKDGPILLLDEPTAALD